MLPTATEASGLGSAVAGGPSEDGEDGEFLLCYFIFWLRVCVEDYFMLIVLLPENLRAHLQLSV